MILAIDATNWVHALWHAHGGRGVLDTLCRRIEALVNFTKPRHVVACFDCRSFRHDLLPSYKAHRKPKPDGLLRDIAEAPAAVAGLATLCAQEGFEADDSLATLAAIGVRIGEQVILASPDKDVRQCLIEGQVTILEHFTTEQGEVSQAQWLTAAKMLEKYRLRPAQWIDYQTLAGDPGDGLPGCAGWGEVAATDALVGDGSLVEMLRNTLAVKTNKTQAASLTKLKRPEHLKLLRDLVTLRTDVAAAVDAIR